MLEGLREVKQALEKKGIKMVIQHVSPEKGVVRLAKRASLCLVDRGYLKIQREWRNYAANQMDCSLIQIEIDVVVPIKEASSKEEYSTATLRPNHNYLFKEIF